jgi:hypothetical protein
MLTGCWLPLLFGTTGVAIFVCCWRFTADTLVLMDVALVFCVCLLQSPVQYFAQRAWRMEGVGRGEKDGNS